MISTLSLGKKLVQIYENIISGTSQIQILLTSSKSDTE